MDLISTALGAVIGAIVTALLGAFGFLVKRRIDAWDNKRASQKVYELLWHMFSELDELGGGDFNSPPGIWYRSELARILMTLTEQHHRVLGGTAVYRLARLAGGLSTFSIDPNDPDSSIYSIDEAIKDSGTVLMALLPKAFPDEKSRAIEEERLLQQRRLMTLGVGELRS